MRTLVYLNPQSGRGRAEKIYAECKDVLAAACGETHLVDQSDAIIPEFQKNRFQRVIIIGGDGTVHTAVNEIMKIKDRWAPAPPAIAVLSAGTGCDLSRSLRRDSLNAKSPAKHKPNAAPNLLEELSRLTANVELPFDVGRASMDSGEDVFYCNSASVGLGGYACGQQKGWNKRLPTSLSYLMPGLQAIFSYKGAELHISRQGQEVFAGHCLGAMIYNGAFSGGGMLWAPHGSVSDGHLDLLVIQKFSMTRIPDAVRKLFSGTIHQFPGLIIDKGGSYTIRSLKGEALPAEFDGEYFESNKFSISLEVAALKVLVTP